MAFTILDRRDHARNEALLDRRRPIAYMTAFADRAPPAPACSYVASDENLLRQTVRHRQEVAADRCRRAGARPARLADRDAAARQAQAVLHAAYGLRRQHRRRQRREGAADRQQARRQHLLLAHRIPWRHQGTQQGRHPRRQASRARHREGGRAHGAARAARPPGHEEPAGLCRARASARSASSRSGSMSPR